MKTKKLFLLVGLVMCAIGMFAQGIEPPVVTPDTTVSELLNLFTALYAGILSLLSYFSAFIPGIKKLPNVGIRVMAIAIIVGVVFLALGIAGGWQLVLGFIIAAIGYDKALKPAGLVTPKPTK